MFKLEKYGNRGSELDWFTSYLSERLQATVLGAGPLERSHDTNIYLYLPISYQGSILGSILFLIFVNDLSHYVKDANLYAVDTAIKCTGHTVYDVVCSLQQEIDKLSNWFKHNHITVNPTKSCSMIIGSRHWIGQFVDNPTLGLKLDGQLIENKKDFKYLGLNIDSFLNFELMVNVCSRLRSRVSMIQRVRFFIPSSCLYTLYFSFIQPYIDYCILVRGFSSKTNISKV